MSYYKYDKNAKIYGDYIERLGIILENYVGEFEVSMSISTLQSIFLVLQENIIYKVRPMIKNQRNNLLSNIQYAENNEHINVLSSYIKDTKKFSFEHKFIQYNSLHPNPTYMNIFECLRNALAHPRSYPSNVKLNGFSVVQGTEIEQVVITNIDRDRNSNKYIEITIPVKNLKQLAIELSKFVSEFLEKHDDAKQLNKLLEKWAA